jgi:N-acetylglucosaminyldiphosphoundecaprenol N-acetyl-beta-D-mannosaminyltransferase
MVTPKRRATLLNVPIDTFTLNDVLDSIKRGLSNASRFIHIVSLNPETIMIAYTNKQLLAIYQKSDLALSDGIGVYFAARLLSIPVPERVPGSVLLPRVLDLAGQMSSRVLLIGSQANLAEHIAKCYSQSYPEATFIGVRGYQNVSKPTQEEESEIQAIVRRTRPHLVFVAFGTPSQELWIEAHKDLLQGSICMGVGGAFDYLSGATRRPNPLIAQLGFEWLYRLIIQPWRVKRQFTRLPAFVLLVLAEKLRCIMHPQNG